MSQPGPRIAHFELISPLGRGGMGMVYLARDHRLQRNVALKLLPESLAADPSMRARFLTEARSAAGLSHPNIAVIFEVGEHEGVDFVAMEYVEGTTFRRLIVESGGRGLPVGQVLDYVRQAAEGIGAAHGKGIIHRDIKPENLMVTHTGLVKVLDFGLARRYDAPVETPPADPRHDPGAPGGDEIPTIEAGLTAAGRVAGTPAYMSPEQVRGLPLDPRTDVFSLAVVACEMLTGASPFGRDTTHDTLLAVIRDHPAALDRVKDAGPGSRRLIGILGRALSKDPSRRHPTAGELAQDLASLGRAGETRPPARRRMMWAAIAVSAVLALAVAVRLAARRAGDAAGEGAARLRLAPLLVRPGADQDPAISPDGAEVVFSRDGDLFVVRLGAADGGAEPRRLTSGPDADAEPDWSPDGQTIAFTREQAAANRVSVWAIPAAGGEARRIVLEAASPAWAPDSQRLAFVQRGLGKSTAILTVQADGRWSRPVTRMEDGWFHKQPAWSPDGRWIAFVKDAGGGSNAEIWVTGADGEGSRQVTREADGIYSTEPAWTPDGAWIVHASNRGGSRNLWKVRAEGGEPQRLTTGAGDDGDPAPSPDGRRILFTTERWQSGLFVWDLQTGRERTLVTDSLGQPWGPSFSPDGAWIAYTRIEASSPWRLFVLPSAGGVPRPLTGGAASSLWPRWSPDGSLIAYCTFGKGDDDIYVVPARGGDPRRLTEGGGDDWLPSWSHDGRSIVFARTEGETTHLYRIAAQGGPPIRLSAEVGTIPDVAPDGRHIALARNRSYRHGVGIMPFDGGPVRWLSDTGGWPVFRPDGRAVGFVQLEPGGLQSLWEAPIEGGEPSRITGPVFQTWNVPFDYAPDGRSIVYTNAFGMESDLWALEMEPDVR